MANSAKPGIIIMICGLLGFIISAVIQVAYDNEWILDLYFTDASQVVGLQILVIVLFLLAGGALGAISQS